MSLSKMISAVILLVVLLAALATTLAVEPLRFYHEAAGVQAAARIRQAEQAADFDGGRIVGGSVAALGAHPYLGGIVITLTTGQTSVCGSSLLTNTRAVTAAHCWWDGRSQARQFTVVLGSVRLFSGGVRVNTNNVAMHASWDPWSLRNDIAMITMSWVSFTNVIQRIDLPSGALQNNNFAGMWATAAGFGMIADNTPINNNQVLRHVSVQVLTNAACRNSWGSVVVDSTLCTSGAGGRGICTGDSGGPLSVTSGGQRVLIGIASFGSGRGCQSGEPDAFARVTSFNAWIRSRI